MQWGHLAWIVSLIDQRHHPALWVSGLRRESCLFARGQSVGIYSAAALPSPCPPSPPKRNQNPFEPAINSLQSSPAGHAVGCFSGISGCLGRRCPVLSSRPETPGDLESEDLGASVRAQYQMKQEGNDYQHCYQVSDKRWVSPRGGGRGSQARNDLRLRRRAILLGVFAPRCSQLSRLSANIIQA